MFTEDELKTVKEGKKRWEEDLSKHLEETPERLRSFTTVSNLEIDSLYTPEDIRELDLAEVKKLLPELELPREIRRLWDDYFAEQSGQDARP